MKNKIQTIIQGLLWIITIVPAAYVMKHCISAFFNGTYHGFNSDEKIYGFNAFVDVLLSYIAFEFIFFVIWFICLVITIVYTIRLHKKHSMISENT